MVMKKNIFLLLSACFLIMGQAMADNVLTVSNVSVPQGGQATIEIGCEFDTEYTAFELQLDLPDGLSLLSDEDGKPIVERAFDGSHTVTGSLLPSNGNYKFTCYSTDEQDLSMPTSGSLLRVTVVADAALSLGTNLTATITACEFTRTADSQGENLADVEFNISITEFRTILDETSTTTPIAEENANVRVKRTINANEWSTICLPFAMTAEQIRAAFGENVTVELGDFNDYQMSNDGESISVKFNDVTSIEANHPYIIKLSDTVTEFTVDGVDITPDEAVVDFGPNKRKPHQFVGTYVANTVLEWGTLFLSDNHFWYSTGNTKMKGYRAYFNFFDLLPDFEDSYDSRISISFEEDVVGIKIIEGEKLNKGNDVFDLMGRKLSKYDKQPGIYIINGKKVVK